MGIQTVELLLDAPGEAAIRAQWQALHDAGLPSPAAHVEPTRRPHITLTARQSIDHRREQELIASLTELPIEVRVGAPMIFGHDSRRIVLVRSVVVTPPLLRVHRAVHEALGEADDVSAVVRPGAWTPHITLARLTLDQLHPALQLILPMETAPTRAVQARRWDGTARREWMLN